MAGRTSTIAPLRRVSAIQSYVYDDMTLEQIGQRWGVTREMIRLDCMRQDPTLYLLARRRRKARSHLRAVVSGPAKLRGTLRPCATCGDLLTVDEFTVGRYCSRLHQLIANTYLRYHVDEKWRDTQRRAMAKLHLRKGTEGHAEHSRNVLAGTVESTGRWLVQGSVAFHWAVRACVLGWPIFDRLPDQIQDQVRCYVKGEVA